MTPVLEIIKNKISRELRLEKAVFSYPPNQSLGDLSLACFEIAKNNNQNPVAWAESSAQSLKRQKRLKKYLSDVKAVGPYLNFYINQDYLAHKVISAVRSSGKNYGFNGSGRGRKIVLEYSNGNTHKEYHIGHLRNISYGSAVTRLLKACSYNAIPVSYINDFGIHTAKTIWNWQRNKNYQESSEEKGYLLGTCYSEASRLLDEKPELKEEVLEIMKAIESRQGDAYHLWETTRSWSIKYFESIYKELNIRFNHIFYENEYINEGLKLVTHLLEKGILTKSEGAIIANLEKYDLGILPVIRTGGTALYPVADLALMAEKNRRYHPRESIYIVDVRQGLYFKQLAKLAELIGYKNEIRHLGYDFVTLPDGMMSSRSGNVITYRELRDKVFEKLFEETSRRHPDWTRSRVRQVAWSLMISTIKFEMLKVGADKTIVFNIEESLRFDGYTACYLQYGYVRLKSLIRKEPLKFLFHRTDYQCLTEEKEKALLIKLARYPEIIRLSGDKYNPSELTKYLFELVQMFNDYYHEVNILKAEPKIKKVRLALARAISQVLNNGFNILGLQVIEEM